MYDPEFFPTPPLIASKMWDKIMKDSEDEDGWQACPSNVLEPSAGRGDLLDWIMKKTKYGHGRPPRCDAVESNPELQMILKGKGYNLIHDDFMTFVPSRRYDAIVMNPPFSKGAEHLLRAWDLLKGGTVVCLLNAETVNNKHTKNRVLLGSIIEKHGGVDFLGPCFEDAQRKTAVEICMVTLRKEDTGEDFGFFDDMATERSTDTFSVEIGSGTQMEQADLIASMVGMYRSALDAHRDLLKAKNKVLFYTEHLSSSLGQGDLLGTGSDDSAQFNEFVDKLNEACWNTVFEKTDIQKFITGGVRNEFDSFRSDNKIVDFTERNITELLRTLGMSMGTIMEAALLAVFDDLTRYDKKNTVHVEGWVTNDAWKVNKKVIVPCVVERRYDGEPGFSWCRTESIDDIDRVMCNLEGVDYNHIRTIRAALESAFRMGWGGVAHSQFFTIKYYKKGTIHMVFKSENLLNRFNMAAAKGKMWLPEKD